jgi:hypothetical protein
MLQRGAAQSLPPVGHTGNGQVIFSRSTDENGKTTQTAPVAVPTTQSVAAPIVSDGERAAITYTSLDLDVRVRAEAQQIAVRALITVRNDGKVRLARIPLQISSSLNWEGIRAGGKEIAFAVANVNSDADHTGQLHEAVVQLGQPLAPGASLSLDVTYSGMIAASAQRLVAIGTPQEVGLHSDWDQIGVAFTGLRGFGNVLWYPATSVPVLLGDGARLFDQIGAHKLHLSGAKFRLHLTVEFPHGQPPTVAVINGYSVPLVVTESNGLDQNQEVAGIATASLDGATLGFEAPSIFVAQRKAHAGANLTAWTLPEDDVAQQYWTSAAAEVTPFLESWLGAHPRSQLTLLDLPEAGDAPFETGAMLATPIRDGKADQLDGVLLHGLTHASIASAHATEPPPAWLDEGVAHFMGTLWVAKQRGHDQALSALESGRPALALAEPESPGQSSGQPLDAAISPVYYRTKAAYVFWMLRDLVDDAGLAAALRTDSAVQGNGNAVGRSAFEKRLESSAPHRDLSWFFADWVDADKGLPDLAIDGVFPTSEAAGNWLVAVNVTNSGYAAAEVAVTVRSVDNSVTQRLMVPARGKATQRILIQSKPTEVQVNDGSVPETQASVHITKLEDAAGGSSSSSPSSH